MRCEARRGRVDSKREEDSAHHTIFEEEGKGLQVRECPASRNWAWTSADLLVIHPQSYNHRNSTLPMTWMNKETDSSLELPERNTVLVPPSFSTMRSISSDFWSMKLWDNTWVFFWTTKFMVMCSDNNRKRIYSPSSSSGILDLCWFELARINRECFLIELEA